MVWVQSCQAPQIPAASCALLYFIAAVTRYCHCLFSLFSQACEFLKERDGVLSTFVSLEPRTSILDSRAGDCLVCVSFVSRLPTIPTLTRATMICTQVSLQVWPASRD